MSKQPIRIDADQIKHVELDATADDQLPVAVPSESTDKQAVTDESASLLKSPMWSAVGWLFGGLIIIDLLGTVAALMQWSPLVGWLSIGVVGAVSVLAGRQLLRFMRGWRQLKRQEQWKAKLQQANQESNFGHALPLIERRHQHEVPCDLAALAAFRAEATRASNDQEVIQLYSARVLRPVDQKAKQLIVKHATDSALMVAVSPFAVLDMTLVLWRSLNLVEQLASLYGTNVMAFSRIRILKQVLKSMMLVGGSELLLDAGFDSLGMGLGAKLSGRVAQGLGAGLMTLRLGLKTLEYCRPVALIEQDQLSAHQLRSDLLSQVKQRLVQLGESDDKKADH